MAWKTRFSAEERFWQKVNKTGACWNWTGATGRHGYGNFAVRTPAGKETRRAPRFSYELHFGPIPGGVWVLHTCDNRRCVNPAHLRLGSCGDNVADMVNRGRSVNQTDPERAIRRGERNSSAKLTASQVTEIRERVTTGESQYSLARLFGITPQSVAALVKRKTWSHVP